VRASESFRLNIPSYVEDPVKRSRDTGRKRRAMSREVTGRISRLEVWRV
jgi:hypothetical protein